MGRTFARPTRLVIAAGLIALAAFSIFHLYSLSREAKKLSKMRVSLDSTMEAAKELETKLTMLDEEIARLGLVKVDLYFSGMTETEMFITPVKRVVDGDSLPLNAMEALLGGPNDKDEGLYPIAPANVKVIGVSVSKGIASVDLSEGILHAGYGSEGELAMVAAIVNTLCGLPEIDKVQILVEGEIVESLGGHVLVDAPLAAMDELVRR